MKINHQLTYTNNSILSPYTGRTFLVLDIQEETTYLRQVTAQLSTGYQIFNMYTYVLSM